MTGWRYAQKQHGRLFGLESLSLLYLLLPYPFFLLGWLRLPLALAFLALLAFGYWRSLAATGEPPAAPLNRRFLLLALLLALAWVYWSGIGGVSLQSEDYEKHNAIFKDLMERNWPVKYDGTPLIYYLAYYLPAAWAGKLLGWPALQAVSFAYALAGVWLVFLWLGRLVGRQSIVPLLIFIFFGGLHIVGIILTEWRIPLHPQLVEYWQLDGLRYSSNTGALFWVPQQAIPAWLVTAMIVYHIRRGNPANLGFTASLLSLWTPLSMIGLLPLLALPLFSHQRKELFSRQSVLCGIPLVVLFIAFYNARSAPLPREWPASLPFVPFLIFVARRLAFVLVQIGFYSLALWRAVAYVDRRCFRLFLVSFFFLTFLPFFKYGQANDLVMRASFPELFILASCIAAVLTDPAYRTFGQARKVLGVLIIIGSLAAASEIGLAVKYHHRPARVFQNAVSVPALWPPYAIQYLGNPDSFFFQKLSR